MNVLFVDDEDDFLTLVQEWFEEDPDIDPFTASSGSAALEILEQSNIDIVVADVYMAPMNGVELIEKVNEMTNKPTTILCTSFHNSDIVKGCTVDSILTKPLTDIDIRKAIMELTA